MDTGGGGQCSQCMSRYHHLLWVSISDDQTDDQMNGFCSGALPIYHYQYRWMILCGVDGVKDGVVD